MTSYKIRASEPYWTDYSIRKAVKGDGEDVTEGFHLTETRVHDIPGFYQIVTHGEQEVCSLRDRGMAEAILLDLEARRITEDEARQIARSGVHGFLYSVRLGFREFLKLLRVRA